ncbi:MAG: hypothetical protein FWC89_07010 [Defluviitaleaceae bacterium]|nr:hypothetical protein [Defluviitaleaceae bacterium]
MSKRDRTSKKGLLQNCKMQLATALFRFSRRFLSPLSKGDYLGRFYFATAPY